MFLIIANWNEALNSQTVKMHSETVDVDYLQNLICQTLSTLSTSVRTTQSFSMPLREIPSDSFKVPT
jgi:hypothetical protein